VGTVAPSQQLSQSPYRETGRFRSRTLGLLAKRCFDIAFSLVVLVFISPVLLAIAVLIKLDSDGPVLYVSERIGLDGKRFRFLKFRTMVRDADSLRGALLHLNERQGNLFKMSNDPRITPLGKFLRRHSMDELPQFFSVLLGHMSVVGPRPCLACEYAHYTKAQRRRVEAIPGITGLWQVEARSNPSVDAYFALDIYYVENWNFWLDMKILFKTIWVVLRGTGQ
jgi:lipopolysaccharide/colanic/teichoic acid biosynthesis glycosyltransferase